jgi:6-phosphogluconolactonase
MQNRENLERQLCDAIVSELTLELRKKGKASLLVSGGSTPAKLFGLLSKVDIDWKNITISLVDERFLSDNHKDQNGKMVKEILLRNKATNAKFIPFIIDLSDINNNIKALESEFNSISKPFSVVLLGMGGDGHTASLFPDCSELDEGMDINNPSTFIQTNPKAAPYKRISLTRSTILNTKNLYLHFYGEEKLKVYEKARLNNDYLPYPIQGFIKQSQIELKVFNAN